MYHQIHTHLCIRHGVQTSESKHNILALVGKANEIYDCSISVLECMLSGDISL
jgi:hypothetical protein